jgi:hypothetical protein
MLVGHANHRSGAAGDPFRGSAPHSSTCPQGDASPPAVSVAQNECRVCG